MLLAKPEVTREIFSATYAHWENVKFGQYVHPNDLETKANRNIGRWAAFYTETGAFVNKDSVEGVIVNTPLWGDPKRTNYVIRLKTGEERVLKGVKEIRLAPISAE